MTPVFSNIDRFLFTCKSTSFGGIDRMMQLILPIEMYQLYQQKNERKSKARDLIQDGNAFLRSHEFAAAINCAKDALVQLRYGKRDTKFSTEELKELVLPAFYLLAESNLLLGRSSNCLFYCDKILVLKPKSKKARFLQSRANLEKGRFSAALKFYQF